MNVTTSDEGTATAVQLANRDDGAELVLSTDANAEAIIKEEEVVKKTKTELTTTKQIETRVKRQVVLEDGKVVQDSGPMVETNTTEDTDRQRSQTVERRKLDDPIEGPATEDDGFHDAEDAGDALVGSAEDADSKVAVRPDGLVRAMHTSILLSRDERDERLETEAVQHLGDFSDETYLNAINSGHADLKRQLQAAQQAQHDANSRTALVPAGPRVVSHTHRTRRTVDTEDTDTNYLQQADGTLVTETKKVTGHEVLGDEELPDGIGDEVVGDEAVILHEQESTQHFTKQRDEQTVEIRADGKLIGEETRYASETVNMERDGPLEQPGDWDSLSDRIRKARRHQRAMQHKQQQLLNAATAADRKDALTERPLDFDREEQTRKGETMKWLENHFGSELSMATTSSGSDAGASPGPNVPIKTTTARESVPTKKTFFNVTIKSNPTAPPTTKPVITDPDAIDQTDDNDSFPVHHRPTHQHHISHQPRETATLERFRHQNKQTHRQHFVGGSREDLLSISRKNEQNRIGLNALQHQQPQHAIRRQPAPVNSSMIDLRTTSQQTYTHQGRARSNDPQALTKLPPPVQHKEDLGYLSGSRNDVRPSTGEPLATVVTHQRRRDSATTNNYASHLHRKDSGYVRGSRDDVRHVPRGDYTSGAEDNGSSIGMQQLPAATAQQNRPIVPQRRPKGSARQYTHEPQPDYPRSRSLTPPPSPRSQHIHHAPLHHQHEAVSRLSSANFTQSTQTLNRNRRPNHRKATSAPPPPIQSKHAASTPSILGEKDKQRKQSVTSVIGNGIRKLVGRIRSVSTDRRQNKKAAKLEKLQQQQQQQQLEQQKTRPKTSPHSSSGSSSMNLNNNRGNETGSTYQQYNVIDGHIGDEADSSTMTGGVVASTTTTNGERRGRDYRSASQDVDAIQPKQSFYLGQDPYGDVPPPTARPLVQQKIGSSLLFNGSHQHLASTPPPSHQPTLGRFSKSTTRLHHTPAPSSGLRQHPPHGPAHPQQQRNYQDYRSTQTLPRKLDHAATRTQQHHHHSASRTYSGQSTNAGGHQHPSGVPLQNTGPAKPARAYQTNNAKVLNRSQSFNVHGLNGSPDQHNATPIYIEKKRPPAVQRKAQSALMYRSTPHLLHDTNGANASDTRSIGQLKSPSIVNLISRSQRDLRRIAETTNRGTDSEEYVLHYPPVNHQRRIATTASRMSPVPVGNRDTASIVRGGGSSGASTDDYFSGDSYAQRKRRAMSAAPQAPSSATKPTVRQTLSQRY